jgi:lipopolysaccharide biosynthesis regulator YciM
METIMLEQIRHWVLELADQRLILSISAAFIAGLIIGILFRYHRNRKNDSHASKGDNAFFKGMQYLLSNDRDHAIEEFSKSVQVNSDTIETYVALGNLYRSKGDIERAIRIRQTIILRPNIDEKIKLRALFDMGLDYRKGGFLDRALETFMSVLKEQPLKLEALGEIEKIYEEMKDWENAYHIRQKISHLSKGDHKHILAHHQAEIGKAYVDVGEFAKAKTFFQKAISIHKNCLDAYLHLGDLYFSTKDYKKAIETWMKVVKISPGFTFLAYRRLEGAYSKMKNLKPVEDFLKECTQSCSDAFTHLALARYMYNEKEYKGALKELESALELNPYFWEARRFYGEIILAHGREEDALVSYRKLLTQLNVPDLEFQCSNCGFVPTDLQWQCPQCKKWDTIDIIDSTKIDPSSSKDSQKTSNKLPPSNNPEEGV